MFSLRDFAVFLLGAEFFHTLSHILMAMLVPMPLDLGVMVLTAGFNMWAIAFNGAVTLILLWWVMRLSK